MRQNKIEGWQGPAGGFVYFVLRSDAVDVVYGTMEGYESLGVPFMPHSLRTGGGQMATQEKVDLVIVGAGASGSDYAATLAKAGRSSCCSIAGPTSADRPYLVGHLGPPHQAGGRSLHPRRQASREHGRPGRMGVGGAALHYFANFPRFLPNDSRIKSEHNRAHDWPISYDDVAPY